MKGVVPENAYALILCITKDIDRETALRICGVEVPFHQREMQKKISEDEKDIIKDYYYKDNKSLKEIGEIYNTSAVTIKNFMVRVGITVRTRGRYSNV